MARGRQPVDELREMSDEDLAKDLDETYRQLFTTRLQLSTQQLANTSLARQIRRRLARIKTLQRERELTQAYKTASEEQSES